MKPGRELDALVAEKVMNHSGEHEWLLGEAGQEYKCKNCEWERWRGPKTPCYPSYSTDIAAAWEVVEKLDLKVFRLEMLWPEERTKAFVWHCELATDIESHSANAESAPHAICLAALKSVGVET